MSSWIYFKIHKLKHCLGTEKAVFLKLLIGRWVCYAVLSQFANVCSKKTQKEVRAENGDGGPTLHLAVGEEL